MWGTILRFLTPIATWFANVFLVPLFMDVIKKIKQNIEDKRAKAIRENELAEDIKKIAEATTPEETENALNELTRRIRARAPKP
jgi:F0F1-type ATP synthase membrane subunit b/b'